MTSAARQTRLWAKPVAIAESVFTRQGAITIPRVRKPTGNGRRLVAVGISHIGKLLDLREGILGLVLDRHAGQRVTIRWVSTGSSRRRFEQADAVDRAGGAR